MSFEVTHIGGTTIEEVIFPSTRNPNVALLPVDYYVPDSNTDRGLAQYDQFLGAETGRPLFGPGQRVLDLGSGAHAQYARDMAEQGGPDICSLNPSWSRDSYMGQLWSPDVDLNPDGRWVTAHAQELPFQDNSFDGIVATFSVPMYLPPFRSHYEATFREAQRVLKEDGVGIFFPISQELLDSDGDFVGLLTNTLGEGNYHFTGVCDRFGNKRLVITNQPKTMKEFRVRRAVDLMEQRPSDRRWNVQ